jgi:glycosyltransferase involved in cell wall biosynthesis
VQPETREPEKDPTVKIGILGTRGIPANYGGFETFAEECGARLAARGHQVTVYGRSHHVPSSLRAYRGVKLVVLPALRCKYLETVSHTLLSVVHSLFARFDVILICNAANSIYAWLPRALRVPVIVNVDGIERLRTKWNWLGRAYYRLSERLSTRLPNAIVTDARVMERYYLSTYGARSVFIPYGAITEIPKETGKLGELGLIPGEYFLYVSRFEPENNVHLVVAAFEQIRTRKRLVAVGDAPYSGDYIREVKSTRDPRILFPGAIYGAPYRELMAHAFCYIHATEVGGSHPALIEAMGQKALIVANGTPENSEVLADAGILYNRNDAADLARRLQEIEERPETFEPLKQAAFARAQAHYSWDSVVTAYERLLTSVVRRRSPL